LLVAAVRLLGLEDHWFLLIGLVGLLPLTLLPAYFVLGFGIWRKRWLLAASGALLVAAHLAWTVPDAIPRGRTSVGTPLRIYSHNMLYSNTKDSSAARDIRNDRPDVVILLELSHRNLPLLEPELDAYRYRLIRPSTDSAPGFGIWSRLPFDQTQVVYGDGFPVGEMTLHVASRSVRLFAVHTVGPVNSQAAAVWRTELAWLGQQVRHRGGTPVILAGDFNATTDHRDFRRLLGAGLTDAHRVAGGWAATWPKTWWWLPSVMRIDHVLVSSGIGVHAQRVVGNSGSDHAGLLTDLRVT
jgi:endonuclease/exonuclease/phosphatase (EEP) superfamily protein YafD